MKRQFTIGKKLAAGFGGILLMMTISAAVVLSRQQEMDKVVIELQEDLFPAEAACASVIESSIHSVAAMRGYMISGEDSTDARIHLDEHRSAWTQIDNALIELSNLSGKWQDQSLRQTWDRVKSNIEPMREAQKKVLTVAQTKDNRQVIQSLLQEAAPLEKKLAETQLSAPAGDSSAAALRVETALAQSSMRTFLLTAEAQSRAEFVTRWERADAAWTQVRPLLTTPGEAESYGKLREDYEALAIRLMDGRLSTEWNRAHHLEETEVEPLAEQILTAGHTLASALGAKVTAGRAKVEAASNTLSATLIGSVALAILLGSGVALFIGRGITRAVGMVVQRAQLIQSGDLSSAPLPRLTNDEVGNLAEVFNQMQASLKDQVGQMRAGIENLNASSAQILAAAKQQAAATREQAATVHEVTSTMEELGQSGNDIANKARNVTTMAQASTVATNSGIEATERTNRAMDSIRAQVEEVAQNIVALSEKTQAVEEITSSVSAVAEQSKLLSLNAAIEAASANGNGSRFSVVATEMKSLADQARESTLQVRTLLGDIQKGINTSVMLTEEAVKRVESGREHSDLGRRTIVELARSTEESVQAFQQIIGGTNQQRIGVDQVRQGMQDIRLAAEQTAASTSQLEGAASNLNALSRQLSSLVGNYKC